MRVISGIVGGITLANPKDSSIRPTTDRVREALFNILMPLVPESRFLDLFAGTGAVGIEALSRGAGYCEFVDQSPDSIDLVKKNLDKTKLGMQARLHRILMPQHLKRLGSASKPFDLIFADPPYGFEQYPALFSEIHLQQLLNSEGVLIIEHRPKAEVLPESGTFQSYRQETYGDTCLSFFHLAE
jgi:16S rRNA (guanine966-N2)-methyltransferase